MRSLEEDGTVGEFVAVRPRFDFNPDTIKRDALIFDRVAVPHSPMEALLRDDPPLPIPDWLFEEKVVLEPYFFDSQSTNGSLTSNAEFAFNFDFAGDLSLDPRDDLSSNDDLERIFQLNPDRWETEIQRLCDEGKAESIRLTGEAGCKKLRTKDEYLARAMSIQLRLTKNLDAYPVLNGGLPSASDNQVNYSDVVTIVLNSFPTPEDSVSWEQIHEYRADASSRSKFQELRSWMRRVSNGGLGYHEFEEELHWLMDQYEKHLRLHNMKTNALRLGVLLLVGAGFADNKAGPIASALASYLIGRVTLYQDEQRAAGKEIAYISDARRRFS
jgi:hypothetical protein